MKKRTQAQACEKARAVFQHYRLKCQVVGNYTDPDKTARALAIVREEAKRELLELGFVLTTLSTRQLKNQELNYEFSQDHSP